MIALACQGCAQRDGMYVYYIYIIYICVYYIAILSLLQQSGTRPHEGQVQAWKCYMRNLL